MSHFADWGLQEWFGTFIIALVILDDFVAPRLARAYPGAWMKFLLWLETRRKK
jgi:hypothetical protein